MADEVKHRPTITRSIHTKNIKRNLQKPLELERGKAPGIQGAFLLLSSAFIVTIIAWASLTKINELAVASGQLIPVSSVQVVQHIDGGQVEKVSVEEGQHVKKGQILVSLRPIIAEADLEQLLVRSASLELNLERIDAILENREPNFDKVKGYPILKENQKSSYINAKIKLENEIAQLTARKEQNEEQLSGFDSQMVSVERQLKLLTEQVEMRSSLLEKGYVSRSNFLEIERQREQLNETKIQLVSRIATTKKTITEINASLKDVISGRNSLLADERSKTSSEYEELIQTINKSNDRLKNLVVRSPVDGIIQSLPASSLGQVIAAGGLVAEIVPMNEGLVAEVQIDPNDIGHVAIGNKVDVDVTTYDPVKYGGITGEVSHISPTTLLTEKGVPYYKALIHLDKNSVGLKGTSYPIQPGMVVQAQIITGAKTLSQYMLRPIYRTFATSFSQR